MTFQSDINPKKIIPNAILEQNKQSNIIVDQSLIQSTINNQINSVNPSDNLINSVKYNGEWQPVDSFPYFFWNFVGTWHEDTAYVISKSWRVEIGEIDIKYLEYFQFQFVLKNGENGEIESYPFCPAYTYYNSDREFYSFYAWDIKDLKSAPNSNIKTVAFVAAFYYDFRYGKNYSTFFCKILGQYANQSILT